MDKWSDDYICDGQLSLLPVDFEKCMNPPETEQEYLKRKEESANEKIQSNTESRGENIYHNNKRRK